MGKLNCSLLQRLIQAWTGCALFEAQSLSEAIEKLMQGEISEEQIDKIQKIRDNF